MGSGESTRGGNGSNRSQHAALAAVTTASESVAVIPSPDRESGSENRVAAHRLRASIPSSEYSYGNTVSIGAPTQHKKNWQHIIFSFKNEGDPPEYAVTRFPLPNPYELMWAALGVLIASAGALLQVSVPDTWTIGIGPIQVDGGSD